MEESVINMKHFDNNNDTSIYKFVSGDKWRLFSNKTSKRNKLESIKPRFLH